MRNILLSVLAFTAFAWAGCNPMDNRGTLPIRLRVIPEHHGRAIPDCMIYIRYGTQDMPASFDDSARCIMMSGSPVATFRNLRPGSYYVYGKGVDNQISETVTGGAPQKLIMGDDVLLKLPVTEGD